MTLDEAVKAVKPLYQLAMEEARTRWNSIAKPLYSLGLLEDAVVRIAGITRSSKVMLGKMGVTVFCADNGVVEEGVTQTDQETTAIVTENFTKGCTSVCHMAAIAGAQVIPVDIGVARNVTGTGLRINKIAYGTQNMTKGPAMTKEQAVQALEVGINLALELKKQGYGILATGEMGIGNTTTSSAMAAVLLRKDPAEVTGRGAGLSSAGLNRKVDAIRRAIALNRPDPNDALDILAKVGGLDIAGLAGVFLGGAAVELPVVIDGFISSVAAFTAVQLCPGVREYLLPSHQSGEPAGKLMLSALGLEPFLNCHMSLGEGTGAVAVLPLLQMACRIYHEMSTFHEIAMENYIEQK